MQNTHKTKNIYGIRDASKGQKIAAALYLVTNHLSDTDPLKTTIRQHAVAFAGDGADLPALAEKILTLLNVAVLSRVLSEQNVLILSTEIMEHLSSGGKVFETLFTPADSDTSPKVKHSSQMSVMTDIMSLSPTRYKPVYENKSKRQSQILSFINDRKSVGIKDIALLFTDVSEKTIQRELSALVQEGKITKRGSKRWSIYMAVA